MHNLTNTEITYTLSVLLGNDGSVESSAQQHIYYGSAIDAPACANITIVPYKSGAEPDLLSKNAQFQLPLQEINGIPLLFGSPKVDRENGGGIVVHADIIASAYFLLTRYEEIIRPDVRDKHGRFPGKESIAFRAGFLRRPIVDEYGKRLRKWLREAGIDCPEPNQDFRIALTHDVDVPFQFDKFSKIWRPTAQALLRNIKKIHLPIASWLGFARDPLDCFDWILEQNRAVHDALGQDNVKTLFFIIAGGDSIYDGLYELSSDRVIGLLNRLQQKPSQLGLHASYSAGGNPKRLQTEANALRTASGSPITDNRHHFLRWREPEDVQQLENAGITDDYTLGYADQVGFRLGVCRPVRLFDSTAQSLTSVTAHPLTIMDASLNRDMYMGLDFENALEVCKDLAARVAEHKGELVLLWHNTELKDDGVNYHKRLYQSFLKELAVTYRSNP